MARTQIRSSQFRLKDIKEIQLANSSVSGSTANKNGVSGIIKQGTVSTPDIRPGAITPSKIASSFSSLTSVGGVITVTDDTNFFIVDGYEQIVKIQGYTSGKVIIQWNTDRNVVHTGGQIELQGNMNRSVKYGDISTFMFYSGDYVREVGFTPKTPLDDGIKLVEFVAVPEQTTVELPIIPISKDYVFVYINGIKVFGIYYNIVGTSFSFSSALDEGDQVSITIISRTVAQAINGTSGYDGGGF